MGSVEWQPDSSSTQCRGCGAAFGLVRRRHHCRACGYLFCSSCASTYRAVPPAVHRVRVCMPCDEAHAQEAVAMHKAAGGEGELQRVHTTPAMARENYDAMAWYYDLWSAYEAPHIAAGVRALEVKAGEAVVELGCGTGKAAVDLASASQPGGHYTGLDISDAMLARARRRVDAAGLGECCSFRAADATEPLVPVLCAVASSEGGEGGGASSVGRPGPADALFLSFTLELFDTPVLPAVLRGCYDALRVGGRMVVVCMAKGRGRRGVGLRMYEWAHEAFPRTVDCRPIDAAPLLRAAGLTVVRVEGRSVYGLPIDLIVAEKLASGSS
jgi:SAM-dependent methyltransferase